MTTDDKRHFELSTYREHLVEHLFMARLLETAWLQRRPPVEVLRCEADMHGYDIVLGVGDVVRHIQLKASKHNAKASVQNVHVRLADKPAGCVVWVRMKESKDGSRLELSYWYFGKPTPTPLVLSGYKVARHKKPNRAGEYVERPNIREIPKSDFSRMEDMAALLDVLFGKAAPASTTATSA